MKKKAFTLIELLVVISVIAVLMGILMPALKRAKEQALNTQCRSNLRNYGVSLRMYLDDNRSIFPYSQDWLFSDTSRGCRWHDKSMNLEDNPHLGGTLWPYLSNKDIHVCPTFLRIAKMRGRCGSNQHDRNIPIDPQYGYTMNTYLHGDGWAYVPNKFHGRIKKTASENNVKNPAQVFSFGEENTWPIGGVSNAGLNDNNLRSTPDGATDCFGTFHSARGDLNKGVSNAVFVDGHVEKVTPYPRPNTYILSWPAGGIAPEW
ncbi:type II secretion system protein [Planctomycetota bacterium]